MDHPRRALAKAATWRLVAVAITGSVAWVVTGEVAWAVSIGALDTLLKFGSYYLHERVWDRTDFGRAPATSVSVSGWLSRRRNANGTGHFRAGRRQEVGRGA